MSEIIDLCDSESESEEEMMRAAIAASLKSSSGSSARSKGVVVKKEGFKSPPGARGVTPTPVRAKLEKVSNPGFKGDDEDVMIIDKPKYDDEGADDNDMAHGDALEDDDGILVVGQKNVQNFPHNRMDCTTHKFNKASERAEANKTFCDMCYCYVCDGPAKDCKNWSKHYPANDSGYNLTYWKNCRLRKTTDAAPPAPPAPPILHSAEYMREVQNYLHGGPRPPGDPHNPFGGGGVRDPSLGMPDRTSTTAKWWDICKANLDNFELFLKGSHNISMQEIEKIKTAIHKQASSNVNGMNTHNNYIASARMTFPTANPHNGPWPPSLKPKFHARVGELMSSSLTPVLYQCQHCQWWSHLYAQGDIYNGSASGALISTRTERFIPTFQKTYGDETRATRDTMLANANDWCHACARVCRKADLGKSKVEPPKSSDLSGSTASCLGVREFKFKFRAHDPRVSNYAKANSYWTNSDLKFEYDEKAHVMETFQHRLGDSPTATAINALITTRKTPPTAALMSKESYSYNYKEEPSPLYNELDGIEFENVTDVQLFSALKNMDGHVSSHTDPRTKLKLTQDLRPLVYQTKTTFDASKSEGVIEVRLFARSTLFQEISDTASVKLIKSGSSITTIVGMWYNIFPFRFSELFPHKIARLNRKKIDAPKDIYSSAQDDYSRAVAGYPEVPSYERHDRVKAKKRLVDGFKEIKGLEKEAVKRHNQAVDAWKKKTYASLEKDIDEDDAKDENSDAEENEAAVEGDAMEDDTEDRIVFTGSTNSRGGICSTDLSLRGHYLSLCKELVIESGSSDGLGRDNKFKPSWYNCKKGFSSLMTLGDRLYVDPAVYIHRDDLPLVFVNANKKIGKIRESMKSLSGLLNSFENLGHKPAPEIDGLNITLHDYQKQAVGWMLDRENGNNSHQIWSKVPIIKGSQVGEDIWFCPFLGRFAKKSSPTMGRGGFLCEEMGLGKTVISLSLILQNPAPAVPPSGVDVPLNGTSFVTAKGWSGVPPRLADDEIGSTFSHGTLVVCHVSLVGQWIEEAKRKLKNPGLVYSYHGGSRKRDPEILASKSIVVTTYATLSSDDTYWRDKHEQSKSWKKGKYVPPCEKVRWWRIILDESHAIKEKGTKHTRAVKNLQCEMRWCVTGTPFNNNLGDLASQLNFVRLTPFALPALFKNVFIDRYSTFQGFQLSRFSRKKQRNEMNGVDAVDVGSFPQIAAFTALMRKFLMRHTKDQRKIGSDLGLVSLPPKVQKNLVVEFTKEERELYKAMEERVKRAYMRVRAGGRGGVMKNTLWLLAKLMPLRDVTSGGKMPDETQGDDDDDDDDDDDANAGRARKALPPYQMKNDESAECPICLDPLSDPVATVCNGAAHVFCRECIEGVIAGGGDESADCPMCREPITVKGLRAALMPIADAEDDDDDEEEDKEAEKSLAERFAAHGGKFCFDSKLKKLIAELKRISETEPGSKSLIFSQFVTTLDWLKIELPKHGFQFRTLSGGMSMTARDKALKDFQGDPPTTIFLLSLRAGAVGINLTEANRVFLMEPALNPALEAQAIGRVHRLGQTKAVEITRLVVKDSVESRIMDVQRKKYGAKSIGEEEKEEEKEKEKEAGEEKKDEEEEKKKAPETDAEMALRLAAKDEKAIARAQENGAGSLLADKTVVKTEEFDQFFGVTAADLANLERRAREKLEARIAERDAQRLARRGGGAAAAAAARAAAAGADGAGAGGGDPDSDSDDDEDARIMAKNRAADANVVKRERDEDEL
jgi:SNF2 family DNA or RNA helicase